MHNFTAVILRIGPQNHVAKVAHVRGLTLYSRDGEGTLLFAYMFYLRLIAVGYV